jgi:mRNA interferase MazF
MGDVVVARGEIWICDEPELGSRPALVLTRDDAIAVLRTIVVAFVTRTLRTAPSQLRLGPEEGLRTECVANFDDLHTVPKSWLVHQVGSLGPRMHELCDRLNAMSGC